MTQPRRARRTDDNQTEIVDYLRRRWGASVEVVNGAFDLLVSWGGPSWPVEVKDGSKPPSQRKLTEREAKFEASYKGLIVVIARLDDVDEFAAWARVASALSAGVVPHKCASRSR